MLPSRFKVQSNTACTTPQADGGSITCAVGYSRHMRQLAPLCFEQCTVQHPRLHPLLPTSTQPQVKLSLVLYVDMAPTAFCGSFPTASVSSPPFLNSAPSNSSRADCASDELGARYNVCTCAYKANGA